MTLLIKNITLIDPVKGELTSSIFIEDGSIVEVAPNINREAHTILDFSNEQVKAVPGFIDIHIHGSAGYDVMDATPEALKGIAQSLPKEGTTSFLATTMTQSVDAISRALENVASYKRNDKEAEIIGVHLEGPFVSKKRAGAQPMEFIIEPSIELFEQWQTLSANSIKVITIAPEVIGALQFIQEKSSELIVSLGHTDAAYDEMACAVRAGARHITHLYNQMSPIHHRDISAIGAALLEDQLMTELIVDTIHSHEKAVELAFRMKGADKIILITDAMRAKQMQAGNYELGGQAVIVSQKDARLTDGTLAGSILTMEQAVKNMRTITSCSDMELVKMSSYNAAQQLHLKKGRLQSGFDADITIVNNQWDVLYTFCKGQLAYKK
ncbi:N-acetylglucosamine-6-phosphate deacetylase [Solibacillus sp. CAU 1738]|uniref:N-acetylglucosamine-6-phosphate deacetylase n=1 Tax=Solibacillus sp. CAU 1738 TaxID=3140363 RepID=UPI0032614AFB